MRITCFLLGAFCFLASMAWLVFGTLNIGGDAPAPSTSTANLRAVVAAEDSPNLDDFPVASTFAQITAIAGVGWMVAAAAFAPRSAAAPGTGAAQPPQAPWNPGPPTGPHGYPQQPSHHPQQPPHPGQQG
ncbi:hypothetical protein [Actinokineospora bangkokensis]|nr:hypothetical protein [Actinokineospora bangkokensis]